MECFSCKNLLCCPEHCCDWDNCQCKDCENCGGEGINKPTEPIKPVEPIKPSISLETFLDQKKEQSIT